MSRAIYADTDAGELGAQLRDDGRSVSVWRVHGPAIGGYRIERFESGKLTAASLRKLFERPDPEPWEGHPNAPVSQDEVQHLIAQDEAVWR